MSAETVVLVTVADKRGHIYRKKRYHRLPKEVRERLIENGFAYDKYAKRWIKVQFTEE